MNGTHDDLRGTLIEFTENISLPQRVCVHAGTLGLILKQNPANGSYRTHVYAMSSVFYVKDTEFKIVIDHA